MKEVLKIKDWLKNKNAVHLVAKGIVLYGIFQKFEIENRNNSRQYKNETYLK